MRIVNSENRSIRTVNVLEDEQQFMLVTGMEDGRSLIVQGQDFCARVRPWTPSLATSPRSAEPSMSNPVD